MAAPREPERCRLGGGQRRHASSGCGPRDRRRDAPRRAADRVGCLYPLTFETNLTGLWALPPRRRVGPLLAGMGFDAIALCAVLVLPVAEVAPSRVVVAVAGRRGTVDPGVLEALVLAVLLLSPRLLTAGVALRDVLVRRAARRPS